jgi:predicted transcriptional regulator of viral defense system
MKRANLRANLRDFEAMLKKKRLFVFEPKDIVRLFGWSATAVQFLLLRYTKRGITVRLKNGLYALSGVTIPDFYVANRLCEPSYVSLEAALSFHRVILETVYTVTSITTRLPRERSALGHEYRYHRVQSSAFTGYKPVIQGDFTMLIADPEKALVDYYYLVARGLRKPLDKERLRLDDLKRDKINEYARLFKNKKLMLLLQILLPTEL